MIILASAIVTTMYYVLSVVKVELRRAGSTFKVKGYIALEARKRCRKNKVQLRAKKLIIKISRLIIMNDKRRDALTSICATYQHDRDTPWHHYVFTPYFTWRNPLYLLTAFHHTLQNIIL